MKNIKSSGLTALFVYDFFDASRTVIDTLLTVEFIIF